MILLQCKGQLTARSRRSVVNNFVDFSSAVYSFRPFVIFHNVNNTDYTMTTSIRHFAITILSAVFISAPAIAQEQEQPNRIMFTNVNVFDGVSETLNMNTNVLVEGNLIKSIGPSITLPEGTEAIDGGGATLMPGLIDSHVHFNMAIEGGLGAIEASRWDRIAAVAASAAQEWLTGRLHDRAGYGWNGERRKNDHRPGVVGWPPNLPVWQLHFSDCWTWRYPVG